MIQHTSKPLIKKINDAEALLKKTRDPEERLAIENYLGNLYDAVDEIDKSPVSFSFYGYLGEKEFNRYCSRRLKYENEWFQKFLKDKKFHRFYLGQLLLGQEDDIEELAKLDFPADDSISRKELIEIMYTFFEDMGIVNLFDQYYKQKSIFALGKSKDNEGFLDYNPVSKDGAIFVRGFKNDVNTMKIIAHEMGHVFDHSQNQDTPSYNRQVFASFYGEVLPRLFEKRMEHFLLENDLLVNSAKDAIVSSAIIHHSDILQALIFSIMTHEDLRHSNYTSWDVETFKKKMKGNFLDSFNYKKVLKTIQKASINSVYRYAYGDILSLFLLDEIENAGISGDLFDFFMDHRDELFSTDFLQDCECEPEKYIQLYQDEIKLVKK